MRIVAGNLRGKNIKAPDGLDTRPTSDRVREALFSSVYSLRGGFEGAVVLDLFAGSGALGLEAMSRGAAHVTFCERDAAAAKVLRANVQACGLDASRARIMQCDAFKRPPSELPSDGAYDLVFLDPPYAFDASEVMGLVKNLVQSGVVSPDAIIAYEHAIKSRDEVEAAVTACGFDVHASKKYGKTGVILIA